MKLYRLYVDESGDHTFYETEAPDRRYLGLLGVIVESDYYRTTFQPGLEVLKQTHFPHSPDEPVILHRADIVNRRGPFWRLRHPAKQEAFDEDFLAYCADHEYRVVAVVIDKQAHIERYGQAAYHPYHYCVTVLLERYCGFLNLRGAKGDVMAEGRGGSEDRQLKEAYRVIYTVGSQWRGARFFQAALTTQEIKVKPKSADIAGLQLADLLDHPTKQDVLIEQERIDDPQDSFGRRICQCIQPKFTRNLSVSGRLLRDSGSEGVKA